MDNMTRTSIYVGAAVLSLLLAVWKGTPSPELNLDADSRVGEAFFPDFLDPNEATGIRVVTYNEETAELKPFNVENKNGVWAIPSHYNYPADGQEQLSKTAGSLAGVERGAVAGETEGDFARLGVVDPMADGEQSLKGRGDRLTLTRGEDVLVDLIIGNAVPDQSNHYYVRKPDEKVTYITKLEIDLSTKFADWIQQDLLEFSREDLREVLIKDYSIDETSRQIKFNSIIDVTRTADADPWKISELAPNEEVKTAEVNTMVNALDELKIIGVRPKPKGLSADLKLSGGVSGDLMTVGDLQNKGYYIVPTSQGAELFSNEGDLAVGTAEGVVYVLRFGEVFTGDEFDIEVGAAEEGKKDEAASSETEADGADGAEDSDLKKSRYLFITVQFDPDLLGPAPVKPEPPATPENADNPPTETTEKDPAEVDPQKAFESASKTYEEELKAFQAKIEAGQKRVSELNERYADWYYVIDSATFDRLNKSREDLVELKKEEETTPPAATPGAPLMTPESTSVAPPATTTEVPPATTSSTSAEKPEMISQPAPAPVEKPAGSTEPAGTSAATPPEPPPSGN
ncbi:MAG: DUF4340 domain-containing protein [Planctomycetaceae bacterium]|nr:DUF4340 domain-containing protein [Planctomycetaceae bacterium]